MSKPTNGRSAPVADLGPDLRNQANLREISYHAWQAMAEGALLGGQARMWIDVAPPLISPRWIPGDSFVIDDNDWTKIEKLLGLHPAIEGLGVSTGDTLLDSVLGLPRTPRQRLTAILKNHVSERAFRVSIPDLIAKLKSRLKKLDVIEATLREADEDESDFLKEIFTRQPGAMRNRELIADRDVSTELELLWDTMFGPKSLLFTIKVYRQNIERALQVLPSTKPTDWNRKEFGRRLAAFWTDVTGAAPTSGRDPMNNSKQTGPFAEFYRLLDQQLPEELRIPDIENAIREAVREAASA